MNPARSDVSRDPSANHSNIITIIIIVIIIVVIILIILILIVILLILLLLLIIIVIVIVIVIVTLNALLLGHAQSVLPTGCSWFVSARSNSPTGATLAKGQMGSALINEVTAHFMFF